MRYGASNADLARLFGLDPQALQTHYLTYGAREGRATGSFDPLVYAASNPDLITAIGLDATLLQNHYLTAGAREGRPSASFDPVAYLLSYGPAYTGGGGATGALNYFLREGYRRTTAPNGSFGSEQANHNLTTGRDTEGRIDTYGDDDWFHFSVKTAGLASVELNRANSMWGAAVLEGGTISVYTATGDLVATNTGHFTPNYNGAALLTNPVTVTWNAAPGQYYVTIESSNWEIGNYLVSLSGQATSSILALEDRQDSDLAAAPMMFDSGITAEGAMMLPDPFRSDPLHELAVIG